MKYIKYFFDYGEQTSPTLIFIEQDSKGEVKRQIEVFQKGMISWFQEGETENRHSVEEVQKTQKNPPFCMILTKLEFEITWTWQYKNKGG